MLTFIPNGSGCKCVLEREDQFTLGVGVVIEFRQGLFPLASRARQKPPSDRQVNGPRCGCV